MKQRTVPWDDATMRDLTMFAGQVLGVSVNHNIGEAALRAKIRAIFVGETITVYDLDDDDGLEKLGDAPVAAQDDGDGRALRGTSASRDPKVKITIAEIDGPGGKRPVPVGVNGVVMLVPRGRPVDIPYRYYLDLTCAIKTIHTQDELTGDIVSSDVPAYPMSVNAMPPQSEIDAYRAAERQAA